MKTVGQDERKPSTSGREYSTVAFTIECLLEQGSRSIFPPKNSRIAFTYFGGVHQCWLKDSALFRPAVTSQYPSTRFGRQCVQVSFQCSYRHSFWRDHIEPCVNFGTVALKIASKRFICNIHINFGKSISARLTGVTVQERSSGRFKRRTWVNQDFVDKLAQSLVG